MQVSSQQAHSVISASYFSASDTNFPTSQKHIVASRTHFPTSLKHFPAPRTYFPVSLNHFCIARVQVDTPRSNFATTHAFFQPPWGLWVARRRDFIRFPTSRAHFPPSPGQCPASCGNFSAFRGHADSIAGGGLAARALAAIDKFSRPVKPSKKPPV